MDKIFRNILDDMIRKEKDAGSYCDMGSRLYAPIDFSRANFHSVPEDKIRDKPEHDAVKMLFIDGGNNDVISSPHMRLSFIRIYACIYQGNVRVKDSLHEFFALISVEKSEKSRCITAKFYPHIGDYTPKSFSVCPESGDGISNISDTLGTAAEKIRKIAELEVAESLIPHLGKGGVIVRDGDLAIEDNIEKAQYESLFSASKTSGVILCGLSKTTGMLTDTGHALVSALRNIAPDGVWAYSRLFENRNPMHPADVLIVRLHSRSRYMFRLDINRSIPYGIDEIIIPLARNSDDAVFLGYPYGLIEADKRARVSNSEVDYIKVRLRTYAKTEWKEIEASISSKDAHSVLDNIS